MNKGLDILIGLGLDIFILVLWAYKMLVTSDIPVEMLSSDYVLISCLLILFMVTDRLYIRKTQFLWMNILMMLIPLALWYMSLEQAIVYHYHPYDTLISILGFAAALISILQLIYRKIAL